MEKKFLRGSIVVNKCAEEFKCKIFVLVTGDRSKRDDHFSGVCISTYNPRVTPIGDFSDTWHLNKFEKLFDSFEEWLMANQITGLNEISSMENNTYPGSYYQPLFDLPNQEHGITPLESEMTDIIEVVEKMRKAQPAPRWVKASERLPEKGGKENSVIVRGVFKEPGYSEWPFVAYGFRNFHPEKQEMYFELGSKSYLTNDVEWLDEQPAAEPLTGNARYELRLALRDMIKLVKRIYGDSAIPAEHQKRLDAADGLLQKHSKITDVLRTTRSGKGGRSKGASGETH